MTFIIKQTTSPYDRDQSPLLAVSTVAALVQMQRARLLTKSRLFTSFVTMM